MKTMRRKMGRSRIGISLLSLLLPLGLVSPTFAIQPDAEYLAREKQFGKQWAAEDKQVQQKLAALEKNSARSRILSSSWEMTSAIRSSVRTVAARCAAFPLQTSTAWQMKGCVYFPSTPSLLVLPHARL